MPRLVFSGLSPEHFEKMKLASNGASNVIEKSVDVESNDVSHAQSVTLHWEDMTVSSTPSLLSNKPSKELLKGVTGSIMSVSYTHLTLPTNREV